MPAANFREYARRITDNLYSLLSSGQANLANFSVDQRAMLRGVISGLLLFNDNSELHFKEFVDVSLDEPKVSFAYHYQGTDGSMIFRYDNAAHRPTISEPAHKHTPDGVVSCATPALEDVLAEIFKGKKY